MRLDATQRPYPEELSTACAAAGRSHASSFTMGESAWARGSPVRIASHLEQTQEPARPFANVGKKTPSGGSVKLHRSCCCAGLIAVLAWSASALAADCNTNGQLDACDLACTALGCSLLPDCGNSSDCDANGIPDECDSFPATSLRSVFVASASEAVFMTAPTGDPRLWIVEKAGRIKLLSGGVVLPTSYLDLSSLVATDGEKGLVGLAFSPDFASNATFFVFYANRASGLVIAKYRALGGNPAANTAASVGVVLKTIPISTSFHNGGCLQFGPDGFLYSGIGDGGIAANAQNPNTLLGKMIRLDVSRPPSYIPLTNPFVATAPLDEIWSFGLRNPWRFSVDSLTGGLLIADVGAAAREEIDFEPANTGGRNYGWTCMEGTVCSNLPGCTCNSSAFTAPIYEFSHSAGSCAVIGGYVYRGCDIPSLQGTYLYADLCGGYIKSLRYSPTAGVSQHQDRTAELGVATTQFIYSFGEDGFGELYYAGNAGIFKIIAGPPVLPTCGNGVVEAGEECDDGNTIDGDGCDAICGMEAIATGSCCVDLVCVVATAEECLADGGIYGGDDSNCTVNPCVVEAGPGCQDLRAVAPFRAYCQTDGTVNFVVRFADSTHEGERVTVSVNGMMFDPIVARRLAGGSTCCLHGPVTVSLLEPSGCMSPIVINCP